jgi:hypothetical protein
MDKFDLSHGIAKLDMNELIKVAGSSAYSELMKINSAYNELHDKLRKFTYAKTKSIDLISAESEADNLVHTAKRLHQAVRTLHHLMEAEKREEIDIIRDESKIEQSIE